MKTKLSLLTIIMILVLPVTVYSLLKSPTNMNTAVMAATQKPVVLEFSAPLCSECLKLQKVLDEVEPQYKKQVVFHKINTSSCSRDEAKEMKKYNIRVVPTMVFLDKNGKFVTKTEGSMNKEKLVEYLDKLGK